MPNGYTLDLSAISAAITTVDTVVDAIAAAQGFPLVDVESTNVNLTKTSAGMSNVASITVPTEVGNTFLVLARLPSLSHDVAAAALYLQLHSTAAGNEANVNMVSWTGGVGQQGYVLGRGGFASGDAANLQYQGDGTNVIGVRGTVIMEVYREVSGS